jgi:hypothetical protein
MQEGPTIEERLQRLERNIFGPYEADIPEVSKPLYSKLKTQLDNEKQSMRDDTTANLAKIVPFKFLSKIPQEYHDQLYIGLGQVQCDPHIARRIVLTFLKNFKNADAEFITWLTQHLL